MISGEGFREPCPVDERQSMLLDALACLNGAVLRFVRESQKLYVVLIHVIKRDRSFEPRGALFAQMTWRQRGKFRVVRLLRCRSSQYVLR